MIKTVIGIASLAVAASANFSATENTAINFKALFEAWQQKFNIEFENAAENLHRLEIFTANHLRIMEHNKSGATYRMAHNQFSHLTPKEFSAQNIRGLYKSVKNDGLPHFEFQGAMNATVPDAMDWTTEGAVTAVKDQGQCGSCWSFSVTGSLEGRYFVKNGELLTLSEQELVDCDTNDSGCNGGLMDNGLFYAQDNGLAAEDDYAYKAAEGSCGASSRERALPANAVKSIWDIKRGSEEGLKEAVAEGPVSVAIEADEFAFQFYSGGVMTGSCGRYLDHGVLAVGYGTEDGVDYWKVKNSWGAAWGDEGYIRIERGTSKCGIADMASFPEF